MSAANEDLLRESRADAAKGLWPHEHELGLGRPHHRFAQYFELLSCERIATG